MGGGGGGGGATMLFKANQRPRLVQTVLLKITLRTPSTVNDPRTNELDGGGAGTVEFISGFFPSTLRARERSAVRGEARAAVGGRGADQADICASECGHAPLETPDQDPVTNNRAAK